LGIGHDSVGCDVNSGASLPIFGQLTLAEGELHDTHNHERGSRNSFLDARRERRGGNAARSLLLISQPSILCSRFLFWLKSATVAKAGYSRLMAEEIRRQYVLVSLPHPIQV
jgi:hypothetical protein